MNDLYTDYKKAIICPYCFKTFSHTEVHFRMESYFDEVSLNDEGYTDEDFQTPGMVPDEDRDRLLKQTEDRKPFLIKDDPEYTAWWKQYGGTTEEAYDSVDAKLPCKVYQLPILNPADPEDQKSLEVINPEASGVEKYFGYDGDGMAISVTDIFGNETKRRVCPYCHNPLPVNYGKNNVKFISVIGITGCGKTVYLSQVLSRLQQYASTLNMTAIPTTDIASFVASNRVEEGKPLPPASVEGRFTQPMVYDLSRSVSDRDVQTYTIVLYDMAGEDCQSAHAMEKYGKFVQNSSAIMLLIDPKQLDLGTPMAGMGQIMEPQKVLDTIHNSFLKLSGSQKCNIPLAVCVSKSDTFLGNIMDPDAKKIAESDIRPIRNEVSDFVPEFRSDDYNKLNQEIRKLTRGPLMASLRVGFSTYNFFAFSATGCATEARQDPQTKVTYQYLTGPATPKRIAEPLFWIFVHLGFIKSHGKILRPVPGIAEKWYDVTVKSGLFHKDTYKVRESEIERIERSGNKIVEKKETEPPQDYTDSLKYEDEVPLDE